MQINGKKRTLPTILMLMLPHVSAAQCTTPLAKSAVRMPITVKLIINI